MIRSRRRTRSILTALLIAAAWIVVRAKSTEHSLQRLRVIGAIDVVVAPASAPIVVRPREARVPESSDPRSFVAPPAHGATPIEYRTRSDARFVAHDRAPFPRRTRSYDATAPPRPIVSRR